MGKLYEFSKSVCIKDKGAIKPFWAPDFCIYVEPPRGQAVLIANLNADNSVAWSSECQEFLGCSADEAAIKISEFHRGA